MKAIGNFAILPLRTEGSSGPAPRIGMCAVDSMRASYHQFLYGDLNVRFEFLSHERFVACPIPLLNTEFDVGHNLTTLTSGAARPHITTYLSPYAHVMC